MRINDLVKMGLMNLWRRKGRTILTILGVLIGSIAVILMVSIALGSEKATMEMIESFGNIRVVQVRGPWPNYHKYYQEEGSSGMGMEKGMRDNEGPKLDEDAVKMMESMEHVELVMPFYRGNLQVKSGKMESGSSFIACDLEKLQKLGFELGRGRLPKPGEKAIITYPWLSKEFWDPSAREKGGRMERPEEVEVFGTTLNWFFNDYYGKGGKKKRPLRLESVGESQERSEYGWDIIMDIELFKEIRKNDIRKYGNYNTFRRDKDKDLYNGIKVFVDNTDNVTAVSDALEELGYSADNQMEFAKEMKKTTGIMTLVLGGIGAISLIVAAIGITNTMVMAIYERTREIGVMKVLGAEVRDILKLFLLEAALIGFIGGLIGIGLSYVGSHFINAAIEGSDFMPPGGELSYIPAWLALLSLAFSTFIGVIAGIIPAIRATRLSALEAIKSAN